MAEVEIVDRYGNKATVSTNTQDVFLSILDADQQGYAGLTVSGAQLDTLIAALTEARRAIS